MAKMFYSLDEAAEKLNKSVDEVKELAGEGKLQQFRDRDQLMFKVDQIDALAGGSDSGEFIPLADLSDTDAIDLAADSSVFEVEIDDARDATGVSVFDATDIETADPLAQTQVTGSDDTGDLSLDSIGSGSGLLDLTRESDDTSLGAELLDEIVPAGEATSASVVGSSGIFESGIAMDTGLGASQSLASEPGMSQLDASQSVAAETFDAPASSGQPVASLASVESSDGAGSGLAAGFLIGALIALAIAFIVLVDNIMGGGGALRDMIADSSSTVYMWTGGLLVGSIIFGVIGMVVGKAIDR